MQKKRKIKGGEFMAARTEFQLLPDFSAELEAIRKSGITKELLYKIIQKHLHNAMFNKQLHKRYMAICGGVPIFDRQPRYEEEDPINNKVNNDFFSEIVDFKVGYFAGEPISYSYSNTKESEDETGGEKAVDEAAKALTDFVTRNNMFGVDMEITKNASICGYSGRLFYVAEKEGVERVMSIPAYETIILSDVDISEPEYAIRYYETKDIDGKTSWNVDFFDDKYITKYKGELSSLQEVEKKLHFFDYCPLQGVANNKECLGDAEKVLALIDDYDKTVSDNSNEIEAFVHSLMQVSVKIEDEKLKRAQKSGVIVIPQIGANKVDEPIKWVTKNINDTFTQNHLIRLEDNIYRFSKTPNMNDTAFNTASGEALKFRLHSLETKCSAFEASYMSAAQYMWKVLASAWAKKGIKVDPLQICMEFSRNFPRMELEEAQTIQAYIAAGLPKRYAYSKLSDVDDVEWILEEQKAEKEDISSWYQDTYDEKQEKAEEETDKAPSESR